RWTAASSSENPCPLRRCGARIPCSILSGHLHDPVRFPRRAAVGGEGLLPARGARRVVRPLEADAHRRPFVLIVALERPDAVDERADDGWIEDAAEVVGPVDAPQFRRRLEEPDG